jgi:hypothetical protein
MVDSLKLAEFLFSRVQETIDYKQYIEKVSIDFEHDEIYGNDYIQVSYTVLVNESFENLAYNEKEPLFHQTPTYTFSLSTNKGKYDEKKKMLRIIEFRHIYESLASYAVLQFERYLHPATSIKVKGIDMWPEANYAEKYLSAGLQVRKRSGTYFDFEQDVPQWSRLHRLATESRKIYAKEKEQFNITDIEINQLFGLELYSIRSLLLSNTIPIKIKGTKTIDEIEIHTAKLVAALNKEINSEYGYKYYAEEYKRVITYLYDSYLMAQKIQIIKHQQSEYLKHFIIQQGDILQLKNMRIVMANAVSIDQKNAINVEYGMLKTDLQLGERTRVIGTSDILFVLKRQFFLEFTSQSLIKHLSLLGKWMLKRKMKLDFIPFELDLTKEIDASQ